MQMTNIQKVTTLVIMLTILIGGYLYLNKSKNNNNNNQTKEVTATTTDGSVVKANTIQGSGYTIEQVSMRGSLPKPIPNLDRPVTSSNSAKVTPEALVMAREKILSLQSALKKNSADLPSWIDLGMYQKMAGDYEGSVISWQYASKLAPTDYISLGNLGNLYGYFLNDKTKSESFYKQAISKGPTQVILYMQLAEVYRDIFLDKSKALSIINEGLSKIPNDPNLLQLKESLK